MSTIDKCCEIVKDLSLVFEEIKAEQPKSVEQEKGNRTVTEEDKRKILKLFNFQKWPLYLKWVDQKLQESGEILESFLQSSGVQSMTSHDNHHMAEESQILTTKKEGKFKQEQSINEVQSELDLLQNQNKKLAKQNILLLNKYEQLKKKYQKIMK